MYPRWCAFETFRFLPIQSLRKFCRLFDIKDNCLCQVHKRPLCIWAIYYCKELYKGCKILYTFNRGFPISISFISMNMSQAGNDDNYFHCWFLGHITYLSNIQAFALICAWESITLVVEARHGSIFLHEQNVIKANLQVKHFIYINFYVEKAC